jgi:hypothetical protein
MMDFILIVKNKDGRQYEIEHKDEKSIWIGDGTGESGEFNAENFFNAIDKFYKDNF